MSDDRPESTRPDGAGPATAAEAAGARLQALPGVLLAGTRDLALRLPRRLFEIDFDLSDSAEELKKKIAWIIRIRFVVNPAVVLLMLLTNWQGLTRGAPTLSRETLFSTALTALVSIGLNVVYYLALHRRQLALRKFVYLQLVLDVVVFTAYLWRTGGVTSPFGFLYFLPIVGGSMLLGPASGMMLAAISALFYLAVVFLVASGVLPHVSYFVDLDVFSRRWGYIVLMAVVNLFAFVTVASASGFLMRRVLQKTRELRESNQRLEHQAELLGMLYQVSEVLQEQHDYDKVLDGICDVLVTGLDLDRALMYVVEGEALQLRRVAYNTRIPPEQRRPLRVSIPLQADEGLTARCAMENRPFLVSDPSRQKGINVELARQIGFNPFAMAPMHLRDRVVGVLGIDRGEQHGPIAAHEFELLILFARQAGQALAALSNPLASGPTG